MGGSKTDKARAAAPANAGASKSARKAGLVYVGDDKPGIRRLRAGGGFRFKGPNGKPAAARATKRIRALAIPPAWKDVWICPSPDGHLQATGRDARGRKQFLYHPSWREVRDVTKYDRVVEFARALPKIRRRVTRDLRGSGLGRDRVLATVVRLMDLTSIRVGNEEYAKDNNSYGLTTMRDRHASIRGGTISFRFRGKSGKSHQIEVGDRRLARIVRGCQDLPGQELFQYEGEDGEVCDVSSRDVNDYLREAGGEDFTARDFRTWAGTVLAMQALQRIGTADEGEVKANLKVAIAEVAEQLGNTPAVCRKSYVHPDVLDRYASGALPKAGRGRASKSRATSLDDREKATLSFLRCCQRENRRRKRA